MCVFLCICLSVCLYVCENWFLSLCVACVLVLFVRKGFLCVFVRGCLCVCNVFVCVYV